MNNTALLVFILLFFAWNANAATNSAGTSESPSMVQPLENSQILPVASASAFQSVPVETAFSGETLSLLKQENQNNKTSKNGALSGPVVEEALASIYGRYKELANPVFHQTLLA
jgi:hypothetical protein